MLEKSKKKINLTVSTILIILLLFGLYLMELFLSPSNMIFIVLQKGVIYALVAVSMNLLNGFTGLFSLGQAGFMLIGAYTYAIFTIPNEARTAVYQYFGGGLIKFNLPVTISIILAGVMAAVFAFLIGLPVLRLKSDYLAIATLGFAEIIRAIFQWNALGPITNGSNLLRKFPSLDSTGFSKWIQKITCDIFGKTGNVTGATIYAFIASGICIAIIVLLINSTYGRAFKAIRDDEIAAEAMGINLAKHKQIAFCISSFFAGISGALLAMYQTTIQASAFKSAMTYEILLVVVIGGIGSITGSCISSFLFIAASEWWLRFLDAEKYVGGVKVPFLRSGFRKVVFSIIIMAIVLFYRQGIMGTRELTPAGVWNWFKKTFIKSAPKKSKEA
ncbi:MAG: branched-chain amino acid ABC transporter permease [Bacillota bacterium]|nr:branched-chain amino acid ABC transporter permease [Bacillota bacterium]